jgi:protein TonB
MISRAHPFLGWALVISILLHALLIAAPAWRGRPAAQSSITVALRPSPAAQEPPAAVPLLAPPPVRAQPKPVLPATARPNPSADRPPAPPPARQTVSLQRLSGEAARLAGEQMARELHYPVEAIERGLQGEALVLLFLDESGNAVAARLEASSGHALLDDAAVRAARTLRALPSSAPREALLPVRFRLR